MKNLKTAVDETWNKVTDHYNEQFEVIVAQYGLSSEKEKAPEILQETEKANFEHQKRLRTQSGIYLSKVRRQHLYLALTKSTL